MSIRLLIDGQYRGNSSFLFYFIFSLWWYQHEHPSKDCFWTWRFPVICQMHAGRKWLCQPSNMWRTIQTNDAAWRPSWCSALALEVERWRTTGLFIDEHLVQKSCDWLHSFSKLWLHVSQMIVSVADISSPMTTGVCTFSHIIHFCFSAGPQSEKLLLYLFIHGLKVQAPFSSVLLLRQQRATMEWFPDILFVQWKGEYFPSKL